MVLAGFKKKLLIHVGIALGVIAVPAIIIIVLNADINRRVTTITGYKQEQQLRVQTIDLLTGTNNDLRRADPLLATMQTLLPNKDQLINFPRELERTGTNYGVEIGFSFGAEKPASAQDAGSIRFSMTITGAYEDIVAFLKYVEQHRYFISVDSVDVRRSTRDNFSLVTSGEIYTK